MIDKRLIMQFVLILSAARGAYGQELPLRSHPRLYFTAAELAALRTDRVKPPRDRIWKNFLESAEWCRRQQPRTEWIPTNPNDPQFENLYDRFYAAMHDLAIVETLAFASVLHEPENDPYFDVARTWLLAAARIWRHEADNPPDASKAYAVMRITKGLAVGYDLLYDRLSPQERDEVRAAIVSVMTPYYAFFQIPSSAGAGYNKHHGSVDAAPFGVAALALLGDVEQANDWLELAVRKHTEYLLTEALTPSGTSDQSSNFWASTLMHRIQFLDALRRVTGRDLFAEFPGCMPGRVALAAVAGRQSAEFTANEPDRSVLFAPNYGQLNYWSPVLVYLARLQRRPIYQYLAAWDESLGSLQHTRFFTPHLKEELLFGYGPYSYIWCDPTVPAEVEPDLPRSFVFPEPEVNEAYIRSSYKPGDVVAAMLKGSVIIHAGGRSVFVDRMNTTDQNKPAPPVEQLLVADDGRSAMIRCVGPKEFDVGEQLVELKRPDHVTLTRHTTTPVEWWCMDSPQHDGNRLIWSDGVQLEVKRGKIAEFKPDGYLETPVHFGGMKWADPCPHTFPTVRVEPDDGVVAIEVECHANSNHAE